MRRPTYRHSIHFFKKRNMLQSKDEVIGPVLISYTATLDPEPSERRCTSSVGGLRMILSVTEWIVNTQSEVIARRWLTKQVRLQMDWQCVNTKTDSAATVGPIL